MGNILPLHDSGNGFQCCAYKAVARGIDGQLVEATRHHAAIQKLTALSSQYIYAASHTVQRGLTRAVTQAQTTALPNLYRVSQNLGDQIRQIVRAIFQTNHPNAACAEQIRGIEHQQPKVPHRDAPDKSRLIRLIGFRWQRNCAHYHPCIS